MNAAFSALANGAILGSLLTAGVWLLLRLIGRRRLNAATRHWIWYALLAVVAGLPLLLMPGTQAARSPRATIMVTAPMSSVETTSSARPRDASAAPRLSFSIPAVPRLPLTIAGGRWIGWFAGVWAAISLFLLLRLFVGSILLARRAARASPIPAAEWLQSCGSRAKRIKVAYSAEVAVPMALGPFLPAILIPEKMRSSFGAQELDQIGLHEAAHLARRDDCALLAQRFLEAIFALHPVIRWIGRQIDLEREIACDDFVIARTGSPRPYAACLTRVAELTGTPIVGVAVVERSQLIMRVNMLLDKTRNGTTGVLGLRLALALSGLALLTWAAARSPQWVVLAAPAQTQAQAQTPFLAPPSVAPLVSAPPVAARRPAPRLLAQVRAAPPPEAARATLRVHVTDQQGAEVGDLSQADFRLFDGGAPKPLTEFDRVELAASVAVILNVHDNPAMPAWRQALAQATGRFNPVMVTELSASGDTNHDQDALLGAVSAATSRLSAVAEDQRVLIVISDQGKQSLRDAVELAAPPVNSPDASAGKRVNLRTDPAQLANTPLERFARSYDYRLGWVPSVYPQDGKFHDVRVSVDRPGVKVTTGRSFFLR